MYFYASGYGEEIYFCEQTDDVKILEKYPAPGATYLRQFGSFLYAVNEPSGKITAFKINKDFSLSFINVATTGGESPCHLSLNNDGSLVYVAHYMSGTTAILAVQPSGTIGEISQIIDHTTIAAPSRIYPKRQETAHAHYAEHIDGNIWVCDLGLDMVIVLNPEGQALAQYKAPAGSGPRHLAFHPTLPIAYLLCEMGNLLVPLNTDYLSARGKPFSTLPNSPTATPTDSAAVRISPKGQFVLVSNRGDSSDTIAVFSLNKDGGVHKLENTVPTHGKCPRDFVFSPQNSQILVACQNSNKITIFDWDENTGSLSYTGGFLEVDKPTCVLIAGES
ncbi:MAG: lactonase family protein [Defluviitaleaceae bacterium]|nr:lactonase family protein [Defluviitaleaceae bacterium]